jgi:hypothetical protein
MWKKGRQNSERCRQVVVCSGLVVLWFYLRKKKHILFSGFILYFTYGIRHSKAGDAPDRHFLHHPRRPTHLNLTPIIPETETASNRNAGSSNIIRFSDNTNNRKSPYSDARFVSKVLI